MIHKWKLYHALPEVDAIKQLDEKRIRRWRPGYARANGWDRRFRAIFNEKLLQLSILLSQQERSALGDPA